MKVRLSELHRKARWKRREYLRDWLAAGKVDGKYLRVSDVDYWRLKTKHRGLGDKIHAALSPFVVVVDFLFGTNIKGCSACAKRREWLNKMA